MYTKVTGDCTKNTDVATASELLCQLIKEEDALQAKIFHELEAEEALQATNAALKAQIEAEALALDETRGRSHVLGLSFSVVLVLLGLGCSVGFCVMRRRGGVSLPTPDTPGTKLSSRAQRANDRIRMLDAEGYVDSAPIGYDAEQGEDRTVVLGGRFETVELGDEERRHTIVAVGPVHLGLRSDQLLHNRGVALLAGAVKRGAALVVRCVHLGVCGE